MFSRAILLNHRLLRAASDGLMPNNLCLTTPEPNVGEKSSRQVDSSSNRMHSSYSHNPEYLDGDLCLLLTIKNRFELYQFLQRLRPSHRFFSGIENALAHQELEFSKIVNLINMYCWNQKTDGIDALAEYTARRHPIEYEAYGSFLPHKIASQRSYNPIDILTKLLNLVSDNVAYKAVILAQAELILSKVVSCESRSVVDKVNEFITTETPSDLLGPLLCSSWSSLYLSPYRRDRATAEIILDRNEEVMLPYLSETLPQVAEHLLRNRQLNRYQVLLGIFSRPNHQTRTQELLEKLFYHYYKTNNVKGCRACVSLAGNLKLDLTRDIQFKWEVIRKSKCLNSAYLAFRF